MCGVTCSMRYSTAPGLQSTGWGNQIPTLGTQLRNIRWFNSQMLSPVSGKKAETPQLLCYMSPCVTLSCPVDRVRVGVPGESGSSPASRLFFLLCTPEPPSAETRSTRCLQHGKRRSPPQRGTEGAPGHGQPVKLWPLLLPPLRALWSPAEESRGLLCQFLPTPLLETCFSFCSFLSGRRVGGRRGLSWRRCPTHGLWSCSEPALLHRLSSAGLRAPQGARSLPLSVPGPGPSPLLHECL